MSKTTERRKEILEILSFKRVSTYEQLAVEFNVSKRTIQTDIEELTLSAPIFTVSGNGGGIRVADGWYLSKMYLANEQEELLIKILPTLTEKDYKTMKSILTKFAKPNIQNKKN